MNRRLALDLLRSQYADMCSVLYVSTGKGKRSYTRKTQSVSSGTEEHDLITAVFDILTATLLTLGILVDT